jgi:Flp pilus assembly protein protease CpaA
MIIELFIGIWLIIGCWYDIKWFHVPNFISYSIVVLCIPLLIIHQTRNEGVLVLGFKAFISLYLLAAWYIKKLGAADVKVLIPIIFIFSGLSFLFFLSIMLISGMVFCIINILKKKPDKVPGFIPITIAFWSMLFLITLSCFL